MAQASNQRGRRKSTSSTSRSRSTSGRSKSTRGRSSRGITENFSDIVPKQLSKGSKNLWKSVSSNPVFFYAGGSIAVGVLARFAYRYYQSHPEISEFLQENISNVESKVKEYRENLRGEESEARH